MYSVCLLVPRSSCSHTPNSLAHITLSIPASSLCIVLRIRLICVCKIPFVLCRFLEICCSACTICQQLQEAVQKGSRHLLIDLLALKSTIYIPKPLCPTHWSVRFVAIDAALKLYGIIVPFLSELSNMSRSDDSAAKHVYCLLSLRVV